MVIIIHHNDNDGYTAAASVAYSLGNKEYKAFPYDYGNDITDILIAINDHDSDSLTPHSAPVGIVPHEIIMVDITLPNEFMDKYAEQITWLDHHGTAIQRAQDNAWGQRLAVSGSMEHHSTMRNYWPIRVFDVKTEREFLSDKISASELSWLFFNDTAIIPEWIVAVGRYDVWDHNDNWNILAFRTGLELYIDELRESHDDTGVIKELVNNLLANTSSERTKITSDILGRGTDMLNSKIEVYKELAQKRVTKQLCMDKHIVLLSDISVSTSMFFNSVLTDDAPVLATFKYVPEQQAWAITFYTSPEKTNSNTTALEVLKEMVALNGTDIYGGHPDACGMTVKDIQKDFLQYFTLIN